MLIEKIAVARACYALSLLMLMCLGPLQAQERVYDLSWKVDGPLLGGMGVLGVVYLLQDQELAELTEAEVLSLNSASINALDRPATTYWNGDLSQLSDWTQQAAYVLPLALFAKEEVRKEWGAVAVIVVEAVGITGGLTQLSKHSVRRIRPFVYNESVPLSSKLTKTARRSFFSGHTSNCAVFSFVAASIYADMYPDRDHKALVWSAATGLSVATAALRVGAGKHFVSDVLVGLAVGGGIGYVVPKLHKRAKGGDLSWAVYPGAATLRYRF